MSKPPVPIQPSLFDAEPPPPATLPPKAVEPKETEIDRRSLRAWEDFIAGAR